jgi:outer membrane protein assembly factor BamB
VKADPLRVTFADGSDLELRFQGEAWATTIAAKRLILLEEDFRHLQAIDPATGAQSWRLQAQSDPAGQHDLYAAEDRALLHAGPRLVMVDAAAGRRLGEAKAYYNGGDSDCRLRIEGGACAYVCGCTLQPIDCGSGAQVGPSFPSSENHIYFDMAEPHDTVCPIQPRLLGRAGDRSVALVEGADGLMGAVGVDPAGVVRWRLDGLLPRRGTFSAGGVDAGISAENGLCWVIDSYEGDLAVFDCAAGQRLWGAKIEVGERQVRVVWLALDGGRLWIHTSGAEGGSVELRDPASGGRIWAHALPGGTTPWPLDEALAQVYLPQRTKLLIYDGGRGRVVKEIAVDERLRVVDDPAGGFLVIGDDLVELDAQAKVRRRRPRAIRGLLGVTRDHLVVGEGEEVEVLRRDDLTVSLRIDGKVRMLDSGELGPGSLLFARSQRGVPTEVLLLGPARAARRARD